MNIEQMIFEIEGQCKDCKVRKAMLALNELRSGLNPCHSLAGSVSDHLEVSRSVIKSIKVHKRTPKSISSAKSQSQPNATPGRDKVCHKCGTLKLLDEFPKHKDCKDGHTGTCLKCTAVRAKRNAAKHPVGTVTVTDPGVINRGLQCKCGRSFATRVVFEAHKEKCEAA